MQDFYEPSQQVLATIKRGNCSDLAHARKMAGKSSERKGPLLENELWQKLGQFRSVFCDYSLVLDSADDASAFSWSVFP